MGIYPRTKVNHQMATYYCFSRPITFMAFEYLKVNDLLVKSENYAGLVIEGQDNFVWTIVETNRPLTTQEADDLNLYPSDPKEAGYLELRQYSKNQNYVDGSEQAIQDEMNYWLEDYGNYIKKNPHVIEMWKQSSGLECIFSKIYA